MARVLGLLLLLSLPFLLSGAAFPGKTWPIATPESQGLDSAKLDLAFEYAAGDNERRSWCASVHRNGFLVRDGYWGGRESSNPNIWWSISKAFTSTLIGIAERERLLDADDLATRFIEEWRENGSAANITIDMLLRHDSGRWYDLISDFVISQFQKSQTEYAIGLRMSRHEPGTHYQYNQMAIQTLERVLTKAFNETIPELTLREIFGPLGFESTPYWQEKSVLLPVTNDPLLYGGMWASCHDLARFGTLWLHRGVWDGHRVFQDKFFEKATNPPPAPRAGSRYHWGSGPNFRANGMGGQLVVFNPEKQLIITRLGDPLGVSFSGSTFVDMVMDSLLDGDVGSWDYERDLKENGVPAEEEEFAEMLRQAGVEVLPGGEFKPLELEGWFQYLKN